MTALYPRAPKLVAVALAAGRRAFVYRAPVIARVIFYGVILLVFAQLWEVVLAAGALDSTRALDYVWYLAITEWIALSVPQLHLRFEAELNEGSVVYRLTRPLSYFWSQGAEVIGESSARLAVLAVAGASLALLLTGRLPTEPHGLLLAAPLGVIALLGLIGFQLAIAFLALRIRDASPVYWLFQKALFVLGGLMLPLDVYPEWLRSFALCTPFGAHLYGVGQMALAPDAQTFLAALLRASGWTLAAWAIAWEVHRRTVRALLETGD